MLAASTMSGMTGQVSQRWRSVTNLWGWCGQRSWGTGHTIQDDCLASRSADARPTAWAVVAGSSPTDPEKTGWANSVRLGKSST